MPLTLPRIGALLLFGAGVAAVGCTALFDYSEDQTPCAADADCDDGNPCTDDACGGDGLCAATAADHSDLLTQQPDDCQQLVCDGGAVVAVADERDKPADPCVDAVCQGTELQLTPKTDGESCAAGAGNGYCQGGECVVACDADNAAAVCDDAKPCTADSCDLATARCVHDPVDGAPPLPDELNNCRALLCVMGELQDVADDSDLPDDGNPCTDDVCTSGVPSNPPLPEGTACGPDLVCDASGTCLGCNTPADCAGSDTECRTRTCTNGQCGMQYEPNGTVTQDQSGTGACKERQCDGAGNTKVVNVSNGTSCNDNLYCNGTDSCSSGSCVHSGDPCDGADGDGDCSELCRESQNDCNGNDPNNASCNDGLFCTASDKCNGSGSCVGSGNPCPGPDGDGDCSESCNEGSNNCTANDSNGTTCNDGKYCTKFDTCSNGSCTGSGNPCPGPDGDSDCTESCNESANNCTANDTNFTSCNPNDSTWCCQSGTCQHGGTCIL